MNLYNWSKITVFQKKKKLIKDGLDKALQNRFERKHKDLIAITLGAGRTHEL